MTFTPAPQPVVCKLSRLALGNLLEIEKDSTSPPWSERLFEQEFKNRYATIYGLRLSGSLVGYLVAHHVLGDGHILNFVVRRSFRKSGLGTFLLTEVVRDLFKRGVSKIWLEVRVSNESALALYRSFGFRRIGLRKRYYSDNQEDALVLELSTHEYMLRGRRQGGRGGPVVEHRRSGNPQRDPTSLVT